MLQEVKLNPSPYGCFAGFECAAWLYEPLGLINRAIDPSLPLGVKYSYEIQGGMGLPEIIGIAQHLPSDPQLYMSGHISDYNSQGTIRLKAVDSDGTVGYSNWFKIGSLGPAGVCLPLNGGTEIPILDTAGVLFQGGNGYKIPSIQMFRTSILL